MEATDSKKFKTVDEYISSFSGKHKKLLSEMRKVIKSEVPDAEEVISYNMPAYKLHGILVYYAAWAEHIGFYGATANLNAIFENELKDYDTSKGTIKFPLDQPLPAALIRKMVRYRAEENKQKAALKKKR
jgi:uncharacterized protein YdhG (YjbR/CyaY superfamily)